MNKIQETCCRLASPLVVNLRSFSTLAALCRSAGFSCRDVEAGLVTFPLKRFLSAAIILVNLFISGRRTQRPCSPGKENKMKKKKNLAMRSILPEHVQPVQGDISANVPGENSHRKPIARLKDCLVKLIRLASARA